MRAEAAGAAIERAGEEARRHVRLARQQRRIGALRPGGDGKAVCGALRLFGDRFEILQGFGIIAMGELGERQAVLGRGALISFTMVNLFLPGLLMVFDRAIEKTTWKVRFSRSE